MVIGLNSLDRADPHPNIYGKRFTPDFEPSADFG
jgi:hypothetical protein